MPTTIPTTAPEAIDRATTIRSAVAKVRHLLSPTAVLAQLDQQHQDLGLGDLADLLGDLANRAEQARLAAMKAHLRADRERMAAAGHHRLGATVLRADRTAKVLQQLAATAQQLAGQGAVR